MTVGTMAKTGEHSLAELKYEFFGELGSDHPIIAEYLNLCKDDADVARRRIVLNCLRNLNQNALFPVRVYAGTSGSLDLMFEFPEENLESDFTKIYQLLGYTQRLAWKHEKRDYAWSCTESDGLSIDILSNDYELILERRDAKSK